MKEGGVRLLSGTDQIKLSLPISQRFIPLTEELCAFSDERSLNEDCIAGGKMSIETPMTDSLSEVDPIRISVVQSTVN